MAEALAAIFDRPVDPGIARFKFRILVTAREREICDRIGPDLKRLGLMFVGIDVIAGRLTEINVTSPTGIVAIDRFNGTNIPAIFWSKVEALRAAA